MRANASFEIKSWDEKLYAEFDSGHKLTRASVKRTYHGDIECESSTEYLLAYESDGSANFAGIERLVGQMRGRYGVLYCSTPEHLRAAWQAQVGSSSPVRARARWLACTVTASLRSVTRSSTP